MLNFTAGMKNLKAAADTAPFDTIITAHKFIEIAGLEKLMEQLSEFATILYLEDLKEEIGVGAKMRAVLGPIFPSLLCLEMCQMIRVLFFSPRALRAIPKAWC